MNKRYIITYNVDIVLCIDATSDMNGVINMLQKNATKLYSDIIDHFARKGKTIDTFRVRIVAFRDYKYDGDDAMLITDFFTLPAQNTKFEKCIKSLYAFGGGDEAEDGLEALGYAIKSKWNEEGIRKRQIIIVFSDAPTHELGHGSDVPNYPKNMAKDIIELTLWWGNRQNNGFIDHIAKRLILFAPNEPYWRTISDIWDNVIHYPAVSGNGLKEIDYSQILDAISIII